MKKFIRRIFALTLTFAMLFATLTVASAASVSWTDGKGGHTMIVNKTGTTTKNVAIPSATSYSHIYGTASTVKFSGSYSFTVSVAYTPTIYSSYLKQAITAEGMNNAATVKGSAIISIPVSAAAATGNYKIAAVVSGKTGTWRVVDGITIASVDGASPAITSPDSGTVTFAPTSEVIGYAYVKV